MVQVQEANLPTVMHTFDIKQGLWPSNFRVCVWACECPGALFATLSRVDVVVVVDAVTVAAVDVRVFVLDVVVYAADMELLLA